MKRTNSKLLMGSFFSRHSQYQQDPELLLAVAHGVTVSLLVGYFNTNTKGNIQNGFKILPAINGYVFVKYNQGKEVTRVAACADVDCLRNEVLRSRSSEVKK